MIHISEVLEGWLVREGMSAGSAVTDERAGMEKAGSSHEGASRQVVADAAGGVELHRPLPRSVSPGKLKLVWTNLRQAAATPTRLPSRAAASLKVVK